MKKIFVLILCLTFTGVTVACSADRTDNLNTETSNIADNQSNDENAAINSEDTSDAAQESEDSLEEDLQEEATSLEDATQEGDISSENDATQEIDISSEDAPDETQESLFMSVGDLDPELWEKIYALLQAVSDQDEKQYFDVFDIEEYTLALSYSEENGDIDQDSEFESLCSANMGVVRDTFHDLRQVFQGGFSGEITDIVLEKLESYSNTYCDAYGLAFTALGKDVNLNIDGRAYYHNGRWSVDLRRWTIVDHAYYRYEQLIKDEMNAAAAGDLNKYMEYADVDLYGSVIAELLAGDEGLSDKELIEFKEMFHEIFMFSYEDLREMLGEDFDGKILQVQQFERADNVEVDGAELYGRMVLTVKDSAGEYQEVEGWCYSLDGRKGVWLQPD